MNPTVFVLCLLLGAQAAEGPRTIEELQQFRQSLSMAICSSAGKKGTATLINLNPAINAWYLLKVGWAGLPEASYHLENASPRTTKFTLAQEHPSELLIVEGRRQYPCQLFGSAAVLENARASARIYEPLCDGRIYLRNPATGHRTNLETATEFLRDHVWGGEKIVSLGHIVLGDMHRETGEMVTGNGSPVPTPAGDAPLPALIGSEYADEVVASNNLGIALEGPRRQGMTPGVWYPAAGNPGIYVSILRPNLISPAILAGHKDRVNNLDSVEASSLCYLVAFDLARFDLGYALGTEHPQVRWSEHMLPGMRDPLLPGPDGIGSVAPLVPTGLIAPEYARSTVATFTGGFKREHGAFRYGELASKNHGSHYGFIENGVVFSELEPGLSTIFVLDDGWIGMKSWTDEDRGLAPRIKHARQNGVPVVEFDPASQSAVPGPLVKNWGPGNWSGSEDVKLRTMRSGAAIQRNGARRFLMYAVFSSATPSAMARVFQAYRCDYAMLLDMNALEHTYMALYRRAGPRMSIDHLIQGMSELDKANSREMVPRFLGYADNRDFFYVMRKENP